MEEYLEKLLSQIRCKKARPYISDEIRNHMEDQIEDNISGGMSYEEAEKSAVADMGDPIKVGISLDKVHRPQIAWKLLIVVGILSLSGIFIQQSILRTLERYGSDQVMQNVKQPVMTGFVSSIVFGFAIMCIIYFIDYTSIAKYSKIIGSIIIASGLLLLMGFFGGDINGARYYIGFGMFRISVTALMMFYVPIYGAILYQYRDGGPMAFLKALIWMIVPACILFKAPNIVVTGIIMVSMLIQLTTAVLKGWFRIPVKRTIAGLWTVFMLLPIILSGTMLSLHLLAEYQEARIRSFLSASGEGNYLTSTLRAFCKDIALVGNSGNDVIGQLPNFNSDYIFSYILNSYGGIAGIIIISVLAVFVVFVFSASVKQKNELGLVMGFGCGMILGLNIIINLLCTIGALPPSTSFLPFFSVGKSNIILCYALVGIIMSIYRYKDVYPERIPATDIFQKKLT